MAGENLSLGAAIGLQGVPKDYTALVNANQQRSLANELAKQKAAAEAQAKEQEKFDKFREKLDNDLLSQNYATVYHPAVEKISYDIYDALDKERKNNPNNYKNSFKKYYRTKRLELEKYANATKFGNQQLADASKAKPDEQDIDMDLMAAYRNGDTQNFQKLMAERGYTDAPVFVKDKPVDWVAEVQKFDAPTKKVGYENGNISSDELTYDADSARSFFDQFISSGKQGPQNLLKEATAELEQDPQFKYITDEQKRHDLIYNKAFDKYAAVNSNKVKQVDDYQEKVNKANSLYQRNGNVLENDLWRIVINGNEASLETKGDTKEPPARSFTSSRIVDGKTVPVDVVGVPKSVKKVKLSNGGVGYEVGVSVPQVIPGRLTSAGPIPPTKTQKTITVGYRNAAALFNDLNITPDQIFGAETVSPKGTEVQRKKEAPKKAIKVSTIKSKVGTKGYEGYTAKELIDYYKSQGYNVE